MKVVKYKNVDEFARSLGLSDLEINLIRKKKDLLEKISRVRDQKKASRVVQTSFHIVPGATFCRMS